MNIPYQAGDLVAIRFEGLYAESEQWLPGVVSFCGAPTGILIGRFQVQAAIGVVGVAEVVVRAYCDVDGHGACIKPLNESVA